MLAAVLLLNACTGADNASKDTAAAADGNGTGDRLSIVTTIFPEYDWVREILGDKAEEADITLLLDNGVDLHSYQPSAEDIMKIGKADIFIYVGGESDEWVEDALKEASNPDRKVIDLLEVLGDSVKEEEVVEGMEHDHEHEDGEEHHDEDAHDEEEYNDEEEHHDEDAHDGEEHHDEDVSGDEHEHGEEPEYDEHVWLSLRNAQILCDAIAEALGEADPGDAATYTANAADYKSKLAALDKSYQEAVDAADIRTVLFGDRFPFRYMTDDYGLDYYAAFAGCSAETEASFETVIFLADKLDELGLPAVLTIEKSDGKIAETIRDNTVSKDQKILVMDSLQSTTSEDIKNGATYTGAMEDNLEVLKEALGAEAH
ncbi:MAG: zinc ABC transporter substrate-binding protein [Lachnospiraceae bacterium]|nr:zinc ABC transporter substrate-binding protein [Lachnospiraceae bacterium]